MNGCKACSVDNHSRKLLKKLSRGHIHRCVVPVVRGTAYRMICFKGQAPLQQGGRTTPGALICQGPLELWVRRVIWSPLLRRQRPKALTVQKVAV